MEKMEKVEKVEKQIKFDEWTFYFVMSTSSMPEFDEYDTEQFEANDPETEKKGWKRLGAQGWLLTYVKQSATQIPALTDEDKDGKPRGHHRRMMAHFEALCKKAGRSVQEFSIGWEKHDPKKKN